jgi:hypothetical protein
MKMLVCQVTLPSCEDTVMKSLSIVDLNFFEIESPNVDNVVGGIRILPFDLIDDSSLDISRPSGLSLSSSSDSPSSNLSSATAVAYAPEGKTSTFTSTS